MHFIISYSAAFADYGAILFSFLLFPFIRNFIFVQLISNVTSKKEERNHHCDGTCAEHIERMVHHQTRGIPFIDDYLICY